MELFGRLLFRSLFWLYNLESSLSGCSCGCIYFLNVCIIPVMGEEDMKERKSWREKKGEECTPQTNSELQIRQFRKAICLLAKT